MSKIQNIVVRNIIIPSEIMHKAWKATSNTFDFEYFFTLYAELLQIRQRQKGGEHNDTKNNRKKDGG